VVQEFIVKMTKILFTKVPFWYWGRFLFVLG